MQRTLLLLLVCASYLLLAGVPSWTAGPLLTLAAISVLAAPRRAHIFPRVLRPLDLTLAAAAVGILLQATPLPRAVAAAISPHVASVRASLDVASLLAQPGAWSTLSVNAERSLRALATLVLAMLTFWSARALFSMGGTRQFCRWLALIGAAAAVLALLNQATAPGLVLGLVQPEARSARPLGAFVNRNHFAAWLLMMAAPIWGYLIAHVRTHPGYHRHLRAFLGEALTSGALLVAAAGIMMIGLLFLTVSRSAAAGVVAATVCGLVLARRRVALQRPGLPFLIALAIIVALAGTAFIDVGRWAGRIESSFDRDLGGASRATIWRETLPIVRDFPFTGTGAGTFSSAMTVYQQTRLWVGSMGRWAHFNHAHSHYLQVAAEGGLLLALPVLAGLVWLVVLGQRAIDADRGEIFWIRISAGAGLAGVAVQSIWEVPLTMPANAVICGVLAGLLLHVRHESAHDTSHETH